MVIGKTPKVDKIKQKINNNKSWKVDLGRKSCRFKIVDFKF